MPRNYLLGMFLVTILVSDPGHVLMQCTEKYCFDFSISLKYNLCSTFSASNKCKIKKFKQFRLNNKHHMIDLHTFVKTSKNIFSST